MILFEKRFEYKKLERMQTDEGRKYATPDGKALASVTTILSATKSEESKAGLENWRKRVGRENAKNITQGAANLGTVLHNQLEKYMLGEEVVWGNNMIQLMAKKMYDTVIEQGLSKVEKVFGIEAPLYYPGLYAGTADLVIQIDGTIMIGDFKNSIKMKKESWLEDYWIQIVAYSLAHNELFGTKINSGRIMMVARPDERTGLCDYKNWDMTPEMFSKYEDLWLSKLDQFYSNK
jgi:genome maintenance exonuclease 1